MLTKKTRGKVMGMRRYQAKKKTFAKAVKAVLNKTSEVKRFAAQINYSLGIPSQTFATWNLLTGLGQGVTTSTRIGDKIYIKALRMGLILTNHASQIAANTVKLRVVVFRGKYDYQASNYPSGEVFEINAGSSPQQLSVCPIDLDQVTPLFDTSFTITPNFTGQKCEKLLRKTIAVNKTFNFREDDAYQKFSNLYLGVYQDNDGSVATNIGGFVQSIYTDI